MEPLNKNGYSLSEMFSGTLPQVCAALSGTCSAMSDGMQYGWSAPFIPRFQADDSPVKITEEDIIWLEVIFLIGGICGLSVTTYFVDKIGRQKSLIIAASNSLAGWILCAFANRVEYLYLARFLTGLAAEVSFVSGLMYVAEISDQKIRGFLASMIFLMMLIGLLLVYILAPFTPIYVSSIVGSIILTFQLSTFPFMPESPYYLVMKGKIKEARKALAWLRKGCDVDKMIQDLEQAVEKQKNTPWRPQDLIFVKSNRKALIIMAVLNAAQQFGSFSVILMNLHTILASAGSVYLDSKTAAIIFAIIMILSTGAASFVVDRYGRKFLLITSGILTSLTLLVMAVYFHLLETGHDLVLVRWIPIVSVMVYAAVFKVGLGIIPIVLTAEIFPPDVKALGMTIADFIYIVFGTISIYIYQYLSKSVGIFLPFYIFAVTTILVVLFVIAYVPETKGRSLEEIQLILKNEFYETTDATKSIDNRAFEPDDDISNQKDALKNNFHSEVADKNNIEMEEKNGKVEELSYRKKEEV